MRRSAALLLMALLIVGGIWLYQATSSPPAFHYQHRVTQDPLSVHILEIDPRRVAVVLERANGVGLGRERVSEMALRRGARAAINGGFFRIGGEYDGEPVGVLKIGSRWYSDPHLSRGAIGWTRDGDAVQIGRLQMEWWLKVGSLKLPINGLNRPRGHREVVVYTAGFEATTHTANTGAEWTIVEGKIEQVHSGGNSPIPDNGFVCSVGPGAAALPEEVRPGVPARLEYRFLPAEEGTGARWDEMDYILGGTPVLISNGMAVTDFTAERVRTSFVEDRHPRTALCVRPDRTWVLIVVDGRQSNLSRGMTMLELTEFLQSLGCEDALNLDGGGSSTFFWEGRVRNSPSDVSGERAVSDAILVMDDPP